MKKAIWILSIALLISISIIVLMLIFHKRNITKITEENDIILQNKDIELSKRQEIIDNLNDNPITKETIKYLSSEKKDKIILDQQEIIRSDTIIINDLYDRLNKTNEALKTVNTQKNTLSLFGMVGLDQDFEVDAHIGLLYKRAIYKGKLFSFNIGGGGAVKIYKEINCNEIKYGGDAIFAFAFNF